ncbi:MAG: cupin domain-containing protein [Lachnospiraceae bacterium]
MEVETAKEYKMEIVEQMCGGRGRVIIRHLPEQEARYNRCGLCAVIIEPGSSLGYHVHHGESEMYYILQGTGLYEEPEGRRTVQAGAMTLTCNGQGHALENVGNEDLVFMALIIKD